MSQSSSQSSPSAAVAALVAAINRGALDAALACYAPDAIFISKPGRITQDAVAIRESLQAMLALRPTLVTGRDAVFEAGDIALYHSDWSLTGSDPEGRAIRQEGRSSDVLRRQPDGCWKILVDNPWGVAVLDATD